MANIDKNELEFIDLFCGAGGFSTGLQLAGYKCLAGFDNWGPAVNTFEKNHKNSIAINRDLRPEEQESILYDIKDITNDLFLMVGGPPCQGFSLAGKKIIDDPRNQLVKNYLEIVNMIEPEWFIIENVPQMIKNKDFLNSLYSLISSIGYIAKEKTIVSSSYGVPSKRKRAFIIGTKSKNKDKLHNLYLNHLKPKFEDGLAKDTNQITIDKLPNPITFREACYDLPIINSGEGMEKMKYEKDDLCPYQSFMRGKISVEEYFSNYGIKVDSNRKYELSNEVYNHIAGDHDNTVINRFSVIPQGGSKKDLIDNYPELLPPEGHSKQGLTYGRLHENEPAGTIPANYGTPSGNRSIHPISPRIITVREAMRLSSFPDYFRMHGTKVEQQFLVGNAVTPFVSFFLGESIKKLYE